MNDTLKNIKKGYSIKVSPMYLGTVSLLEAQEINREQKQFHKYYEFEVKPEECTTLEIHYHWNGFNVGLGEEEDMRALIYSVVERLDRNLVGKLFNLETIVKEVQRFRKEFNDIGYGLCLSLEMAQHLEHLIDKNIKYGEYSFFTHWHRDVTYEEWLQKVWNT